MRQLKRQQIMGINLKTSPQNASLVGVMLRECKHTKILLHLMRIFEVVPSVVDVFYLH